jgi:hypothetical protein
VCVNVSENPGLGWQVAQDSSWLMTAGPWLGRWPKAVIEKNSSRPSSISSRRSSSV